MKCKGVNEKHKKQSNIRTKRKSQTGDRKTIERNSFAAILLSLSFVLEYQLNTIINRINTTLSSLIKRKIQMDTFYISHGSPTLSFDDSIPARHFLKSWKEKGLCQRPRAILVVSGHWDTPVPAVNVISGRNDTIHDFYGFPKHMYQVYYTTHIN
jgi:hypothetical protein